ncbi:Uu.00g123310.m01.CDS01 [Anthostomella pinea]|uniref:Uu.00g123310.m01.CDS01 n=1 Tax=Anthostomella pinea TaxID=933095 RepID=A0AAI8YHM1_9PEZI|nr:Uu.00g123310.m01.CDS01 [Anthostomella pinea]
MAVLHEPYISDEEFDVVEAAQPVSDLSSPAEEPGSQQDLAGRRHVDSLDRRQSGVPAPSRPYYDQTVDAAAQRLAHSSLEDSYVSTASWNAGDGVGEGSAGDGIPGLSYTKSVVQKFWTGRDLLIAVMGMTGSGKTTFISKVTGRTDLEIGHSLTSCTRDIQVVETKIEGRTVRFVDTPGFSDTNLSDSEVLQLIADYLAAAYRQDMKLSGIIYMHPISDTRVTHHATKNLQMFQKLTGEKNLKNVVLATSMWDKVTQEQGLARERELKDKFWKVMLAYQAKAVRYGGTLESALHIAHILMNNKPFYLQLQEEMGKDNKALRDTTAGREVMIELLRMKEEHQRELADMETMMKSSAEENRSVVEALKEHYQGRLGDLEKTLRDERRMNEAAVQSLTERIMALENRGVCAVM